MLLFNQQWVRKWHWRFWKSWLCHAKHRRSCRWHGLDPSETTFRIRGAPFHPRSAPTYFCTQNCTRTHIYAFAIDEKAEVWSAAAVKILKYLRFCEKSQLTSFSRLRRNMSFRIVFKMKHRSGCMLWCPFTSLLSSTAAFQNDQSFSHFLGSVN